MRVLAISGSLRRDSHNTRLLRAAALALSPGGELELYDGLAALPPYSEDSDVDPAPAPVEDLRVQRLDPRCAQERDRLGLAAVPR
jgi:chromate reductase, NAD(P)H dehydrogenase (quinone)